MSERTLALGTGRAMSAMVVSLMQLNHENGIHKKGKKTLTLKTQYARNLGIMRATS